MTAALAERQQTAHVPALRTQLPLKDETCHTTAARGRGCEREST